jgi:flagellar hook-associated protein 3 FlgL
MRCDEEQGMSGSITMTGVTGYATLARLIQDSEATHRRLDNLTNQVSTGLVADNYAGLGNGASVSLDLRPQIANLRTWQNNVDAATGRMTVAQSALTQIQSVAADFYTQLNNVQGVNASAVDTIAASARDALRQVAGLLDTQDGGVYVFAGQDTANAPVPDPDHIADGTPGTFFGEIQADVGQLGVQTAAWVAQATFGVASYTGIAGPPSPFSDYLSTTDPPDLPTVQVGQNSTETTGLSASHNGLIPLSVGGPVIPGGPNSTTGSYMRDVLRALATIGSLSTAQVNTPGFQDLVQDTRISLSGAIGAMAQDAGVLGNVQSSLTATQSRLADTETTLTGQVSSAEDVDMAATLSRLSVVQTQMQASYQLIATLNGLSLVKFLPVG